MAYQHESLAAGRWRTMTLAEQMGNIGSEVNRMLSWGKRHQYEQQEKSFVRMLELLDFTLDDDRWRGPRRKEIARVREALCDSFTGGIMGGPLSSWPRYFDAFAFFARSKK